jgi:hypothetical protein
MASLLEDFNLWLVQTSAEVEMPLEVFILLLSVNIILLTLLLIFIVNRIRTGGGLQKSGQEFGAGRKSGMASGTLAELIEEE